MAKLFVIYLIVTSGIAITCNAINYLVGDNSGWDVSTDLDSWAMEKRFTVGDVLVFQYFSSSHSVNEVTRENFNKCNTTNVLKAYSNGNTTVTLTKPGWRYFICGNRLHCLGGMKLQVNVEGNGASSPIGAPQAQPGANFPQPSSKSHNPSTVVPTSAGFMCSGRASLAATFLAFVVTLLWMAQV